MAQIRVRHAEGNAQFPRGLDQVVGFLEVQAKGFFAEDRDAGLHGLHRGVVVDKVGRDDEDVIQPLIFGQGRGWPRSSHRRSRSP